MEGQEEEESNSGSHSIKEENPKKITKFFRLIEYIFEIIAAFPSVAFLYIVFANLLHLAFYPLIFGWISLSSKKNAAQIVFLVIYLLSDFALFNCFFNIIFILEKNFVKFFSLQFDDLYRKFQYKSINVYIEIFIKVCFYIICGFILAQFFYFPMFKIVIILIDLICLYSFYVLPSFRGIKELIINKYPAKVSNESENDLSLKQLKELIKKLEQNNLYIEYKTELEYAMTVLSEHREICIRDIKEYQKDVNLLECIEKITDEDFQYEIIDRTALALRQYNIISILVYDLSDFSRYNTQMNDKYQKRNIIYKIVIGLLVLIGQIYIIYIACSEFKNVNTIVKVGIVIGVIFRILGLYRATDFNIYDTIFNIKCLFKKKNFKVYKITIVLTLLLYLLAIIFLCLIKGYVLYKDLPNISELNYIQNNEVWNRHLQKTAPPSFCSIPQTEPFINIDDAAVLSTLPRLYEINNGKCYIKPKMRGVFNSTMKYIFGENYKDDNITILCFPFTTDPYLILTSDKFYNKEREFINESAVIIDRQFAAESKDYFNKPLCEDGFAIEKCLELKKGISSNYSNISLLWDLYTNSYWKEYTGDASNTPGLEQYQYTWNYSTVIQPRIIDERGERINGLHIIIGGGFENQWGYSYHIENLVRKNLPILFQYFVPLYKLVTSYFKDIFNYVTEFILGLVYVETLSYKELAQFSNLISSFNFSHNKIFMIGHSISATTIKELSYISDINGITFEASLGNNKAKYSVSKNYNIIKNNTNSIANIYSKDSLFSGIDDGFKVNGKLTKLFFNPNVFDDACLVAVTCSKTQKYVPFCKQALNQGGENPILKYNEMIDAFNEDYF